jgi:hypothetical protein
MPWLTRRAGRRCPESGKQKVRNKKGRNEIVSTLFVVAMPADVPPPSGSGFQLGIKIGDHILER